MILGMSIYEVCMYFIIYSFVGWCIEVIYHALSVGKIINRGFLNGPVCPVYGFGMLAVVGMVNQLPKNENGNPNTFFVFLGGMLLTTAIELVAGWMLFHFFHARWWDYSDVPLNLGGYICPLFSVYWGIGCVLIVKFGHPLVDALVDFTPQKYGWPIIGVLSVVYIADFILTVLTVIGLNKKIAELDKLNASMRVISDGLSDTLAGTTLKAMTVTDEAKLQMTLAKAEMKDAYEVKKEETAGSVRRAVAITKAVYEAKKEKTAAKRDEALVAVKEKVINPIMGSYEAAKKRSMELTEDILGHKFFGTGRLLRAFPKMKYVGHENLLKELEDSREKNEKSENIAKNTNESGNTDASDD